MQERRKAAVKAADSFPSTIVDVEDVVDAAKADETSENNAAKAGASETSEEKTNTAEDDLSCLICNFERNWANGLKIHMAKKNANLEQVDGNDIVLYDIEDYYIYSETEHYWKTRNNISNIS
jgi:hypothetical protein